MDYEGFKSAMFKLSSIDLNAYKEQQMKRRIDTLISRRKISGYEEFIKNIKSDKDLYEEFVSYLTINVSEFYRNPEQWEYMDKSFIPELIGKFGRNLKIWSAACSTGDEPYSLVMAFSKHLPLKNIKIIATDIDKQIIAQAKVGIYNEKSVSGVPKDLRDKYFTQIGHSYQIKDEIKSCVEFKQHNLIKDPFLERCDFIVCRNVLIYFTDDAKNEVFRKFHDSLKTGALLFIGSTEQIMNHKAMGYERKNSFFYERID